MREFLAIGGLLFAVPATGFALLSWAGWRARSGAEPASDSRRVPLTWGVSVATGLAACVFALYLPLMATGGVFFAPALALLVAGSGFSLFRAAKQPRRTLALLRHPFWIGAGVIAFMLIYFGTTAPFWGYDGKAIYGVKANALLHERDLEGAIFQDPEVVHYHGDYPLGLPLVIALTGYAAGGPPDDPTGTEPALTIVGWLARHHAIRAYSGFAFLWILGLFGFVVHGAREATSGRATQLVLCAIALPLVTVFPWVGGRSFSLEGADVPLALTLGAVGWLYLDHVRRKAPGALGLALLLAASAMWIKNDALVALGTLLLATSLCEGSRRTWKPALALAAAAGMAGVLAGSLAATTAGAPYDEHYVQALLATDFATLSDRIPLLLSSARAALEKREMFAYWAFVLCIAAPWCLYRGGSRRILALWVVGHVAAMSAIFLVTPNSVTWHVTTALPRLWSQVTLPAAAILIACVADAWRQLVREARPPTSGGPANSQPA